MKNLFSEAHASRQTVFNAPWFWKDFQNARKFVFQELLDFSRPHKNSPAAGDNLTNCRRYNNSYIFVKESKILRTLETRESGKAWRLRR